MKIRKVGISAMALVAAVAMASAAEASSVTLSLPGDINQAVDPGVKGGLNVNFMGSTYNGAYVGQINWTVTSSTDPMFTANQKLGTYCIQGLQDVYTGSSYTYNVVGLTSVNLPLGGGDAGVLDSVAASQIQGFADSYFAMAGTSVGGYTANETSAAFQLAIWEIEYDGGQGGESFPQSAGFNYFSQGNLSAVGTNGEGIDAIALANTWLNGFSAARNVNSLALVSDGAQDQFVYQPGGGSTPPTVPLPAAFPGGVALLGGLFGARKLKRK
jgi:hypothetical protein